MKWEQKKGDLEGGKKARSETDKAEEIQEFGTWDIALDGWEGP